MQPKGSWEPAWIGVWEGRASVECRGERMDSVGASLPPSFFCSCILSFLFLALMPPGGCGPQTLFPDS